MDSEATETYLSRAGYRTQGQTFQPRGSLDLRRPIMSNSTSQVGYFPSEFIDLTASDDVQQQERRSDQPAVGYRAPYAEVIDLEESGPGTRHEQMIDPEAGLRATSGPSRAHVSDEVEFLFERQLANRGRNSSQAHNSSARSRMPAPGSILPVPWQSDTAYSDNIWNLATSFSQVAARHFSQHMPGFGTRLPTRMDYSRAAFSIDMGGLDEYSPMNRTPTTPKVDELNAAPEGFTRTPEEGTNLICPNCERELTVGQTDSQKCLFVAKGCGHVYCGECAQHRAQTKRKREKLPSTEFRTKAFSVCVVNGCKQNLKSPNAMVQIFL